jgi:hypothetical protein
LKHLYLLRLSLLVAALWTLSAQLGFGQTTQAAGSWSTPGTWVGNAVPAPGANVVIRHNVTLNQNASVNNIDIQVNTLTIGSSITVRTLNVAGTFLMSGGNVTVNPAAATHNLNITGNFTHNAGTFTASNTNGRIATTFNGASQTVGGSVSTTFFSVTAAGGTLNIGSTLIVGGVSGPLTINSGATWSNTSNFAVTFRGGIINNGTFNPGTATQTFDTNNQSLTGTF